MKEFLRLEDKLIFFCLWVNLCELFEHDPIVPTFRQEKGKLISLPNYLNKEIKKRAYFL